MASWSPTLCYLICQMKTEVFFNKFQIILINNNSFSYKQWLYCPKDRNRNSLFTNLLHYYNHQWSDINISYVKWKLESFSINFQSSIILITPQIRIVLISWTWNNRDVLYLIFIPEASWFQKCNFQNPRGISLQFTC